MRKGTYDYDNEESSVNKIKNVLEGIDPAELTAEESRWRDEILWFWHHHAAGYALFGRKDHEVARRFAEVALDYQADDHPNKITKLLYLLADKDVAGAEEHIATIPADSVEYESAEQVLKMYKDQQAVN